MEDKLILTIITLASAVAIQWKVQYNAYKNIERRTEECEKDRIKLWERVTKLSAGQCIVEDCPKYQQK